MFFTNYWRITDCQLPSFGDDFHVCGLSKGSDWEGIFVGSLYDSLVNKMSEGKASLSQPEIDNETVKKIASNLEYVGVLYVIMFLYVKTGKEPISDFLVGDARNFIHMFRVYADCGATLHFGGTVCP